MKGVVGFENVRPDIVRRAMEVLESAAREKVRSAGPVVVEGVRLAHEDRGGRWAWVLTLFRAGGAPLAASVDVKKSLVHATPEQVGGLTPALERSFQGVDWHRGGDDD